MLEAQPDAIRRGIAKALREAEMERTEAWDHLTALASSVAIDSIEIFEGEIQIEGKYFSGPILWYVTLRYGSANDELTVSESLPGKFDGTLEGGKPIIRSITADTSSLFE